MSGLRMLKELGYVTATHRAIPLLLIAVSAFVLSLVLNVPIALSVSMMMAVAVCRGIAFLNALCLVRCRIDIDVSGRSEDDELNVVIRMENRSVIPIYLAEISLEHSPHLRLVRGSKSFVVTLPPRGVVEIRLAFEARVGKHFVGPLNACVRDPLGLFRSRIIRIGPTKEVLITPRVTEAYIRKLFVRTRSSGVVRSREPGMGIEFHSVREFRPGDDLRRVDWKHFAASRRLIVKEMEREAFQSVIFLVDATSAMLYGPRKNTPLEHVLRVVASISRYLALRGDVQGVLIYSRKGITFSGLWRGRRAFEEILKSLASVELDTEPLYDDERAELLDKSVKFLVAELPRERNAVFIFTSSGEDRYFDALRNAVLKLSSLGNVVYVVIPMTIMYQISGLPRWSYLALRVKTYEILKREQSFAQKLRRYGARTVAAFPHQLPSTIIEIIDRLSS